MKTNRQKGFTLIELMIVVAIIGILAAIPIPAYENYIAKAQFTEAISLISGQKIPVANYYMQNDTCPSSGQTTGFPAATSNAGKYVLSVADGGTASGAGLGGCQISALFRGTGVNSGLAGKTATFTMSMVGPGSPMIWTCTSSSISQSLMPRSCVGP